jgi:hypothetical protein
MQEIRGEPETEQQIESNPEKPAEHHVDAALLLYIQENNFHLENLTLGECVLDLTLKIPNPPVAPFNKFIGAGTGRLNRGSRRFHQFHLH